MQAIREKIYCDSENLSIQIPEFFRKKNLEILVLPLSEEEDNMKNISPEFNAIGIKTSNFKFDREEIHER